ncbi:MAG: tail fiber assembly protein [Stenotrophomonas sp.]|uniref:tail fiber assembly protein n=1 Tax=Stenotrophomonas sp. TaxID=69392 RepID=UPI003D6D6184
MYAITETSYRAVTPEMPLNAGETRVDEIPAAVLTRIRAEQMKVEREQRLRSTDWTQMDDAPLLPGAKQEWAGYRQALRELPAMSGFPDCPWPSSPALPQGTADVGEPRLEVL